MTQDTMDRLSESIQGLIDQIETENTDTENTTSTTVEEQRFPEYPNINRDTEIPESSNAKIPVNSETITIDMRTSRFSSAVWYDKVREKVITLAGLGGIGSYTGFLISRMHPTQIFIYDNDIVESVNMSGQFYGTSDIGKPKARAMTDMIHNYSNFYGIASYNERYLETSVVTDIMICGFDNMEARKTFYNVWKHHVMSVPEGLRKHCLFIDGRIKGLIICLFKYFYLYL